MYFLEMVRKGGYVPSTEPPYAFETSTTPHVVVRHEKKMAPKKLARVRIGSILYYLVVVHGGEWKNDLTIASSFA